MSKKILLIDIETSPLVCYTWGLYEQDVIKKIKQSTILSVAYQWLGQKTKVMSCAQMSEHHLLKRLHRLLSDADIVVAHNGDAFDIKKINTRFIIHNILPPSPYQTIDTKMVAKSVGAFDSNSLNNLGIDMSEGEKLRHRGFDMWEGCMAGKSRDWRDMKRYNKKDVDLLAKVYLRLRPWMKNHPEVRPADRGVCQSCSNDNLQRRGTFMTKTKVYTRYQCLSCGSWNKEILKKRRPQNESRRSSLRAVQS